MSIDKIDKNPLDSTGEIKKQENMENPPSVFDDISEQAKDDLEGVLERTEDSVEQVRQKKGVSEEDISEAKDVGEEAKQASQEADGKFTEAVITEELNNLSNQEKEKFLEGFANLGFRTTELKSKIIGGFLGKISNNTKNKKLATFFGEYENIYKKLGENAKNSRLNVGKGVISRMSGLGQGAGNILKYTRVLYDLNVLNPLRHVMAASMFVGRTSEAVKETRFESEETKEKTRVNDIDRATEEAWRIYEEAKIANNGEAPKAEDLNKEYKKQLPKDLQERLNRIDGLGVGFISNVLNKDVKWAVDRLDKNFEKIDQDSKLSDSEKEAKKQALLDRNKAFLEDLDRMVADQGMIDNIAYYSRLSEKAGKATATVMMIDSVARFARMAPQVFEPLDKAAVKGLKKTSSLLSSLGFTPSDAIGSQGDGGLEEQMANSPFRSELSEADTEAESTEEPQKEIKEEEPSEEAGAEAETSQLAHDKAMESVGDIQRGDSVWSVSGRYLNSRLEDKLGEFAEDASASEAYKTYYTDKLKDVIVADPSKYGLPPGKAFYQLSVDDLKGLELDKAFKDAFPEGTDEKVLNSDQIKNIINNNNKLKSFFETNPKAPRSIENFNKILEGNGQTLSDAEISRQLNGIEAQMEAMRLNMESTVSGQIDQEIKGIYKRFLSNQIYEYQGEGERPGIKELPASQIMTNDFKQADFGDPYGGKFDMAELRNRKGLYNYLQELKTNSDLEPKSDETVEKYIKRAQTEIALRENEVYQNLLNQRNSLETGSGETMTEVADPQVEITRGLREGDLEIIKALGYEYDPEEKAILLPERFVNLKGERAELTLNPGEKYVGVRKGDDNALIVETIKDGKTQEYVVRIDDDEVYFNRQGEEPKFMDNIKLREIEVKPDTTTTESLDTEAGGGRVEIENNDETAEIKRPVLTDVKLFNNDGVINNEAKGELVKLILNKSLKEGELIDYFEKNYKTLYPDGTLSENFDQNVKDIFNNNNPRAINLRLGRLAEAIQENNFKGLKSLEARPVSG